MDNKMSELINVTLDNIKNLMANENIVGKPIVMPEGSVVIPFSKVTVGFVTGGGNISSGQQKNTLEIPFAGGGGGGINISPIGFLVCNEYSKELVKIDKEEEENKWQTLLNAVMDLLKTN